MLQRFFIFILCSLLTSGLLAQEEINYSGKPDKNDIGDRTLLYRYETVGGVVVHTEGWGFAFRKGKHLTGFRKRMLEVEVVGMKHPKEIKRAPLFNDARSYVYGKMNALLILRPGIGIQRVIHFPSDRNGIEVRGFYYGGLSLGLAKPMYLYIIHTTSQEDYLTIEKYDPQIHYLDNIYGRGPFYKGMDELRLYPGAYAKIGFNFEYSSEDDRVKALEFGVTVDGYPKNIPIMAYTQNKNLFFSIYLAFYFGAKK